MPLVPPVMRAVLPVYLPIAASRLVSLWNARSGTSVPEWTREAAKRFAGMPALTIPTGPGKSDAGSEPAPYCLGGPEISTPAAARTAMPKIDFSVGIGGAAGHGLATPCNIPAQ